MRRPLKWLVGALGLLAALGLAVGLALFLLLDPVRVRDQLAVLVHDQTGRVLQIAGPVELSLAPSLGVVLREVRLGNAAGVGENLLAKAAELRVRLKALPLLSGRVEIDSLAVRGLVLDLGRRAKGEPGWTLAGDGILALDGRPSLPPGYRVDLAGRAAGKGLPAQGIALEARADLRYDPESRALVAAPVEMAATGLRLRGEIRGHLVENPDFEGRLEVTDASPRALLAMLGAPEVRTADPAALGRLTATVPFRIDARAFVSDGLSLTLDDTSVTGRLAVTDLASGTTSFELAADRLDLDRYLPAPEPPAPGGAVGGEAAGRPEAAGALVGGAAALPAEALRALDLDGSVQIGALTAGGARLAEFRAHWRAAAGAVTQTAEARLYGGSARATSTLDVNPAPPAMTLEGALQDVDLRGLLADTARSSRLSGIASIDADLRWRGLSEAELKRSLDGRARVAVRDGAVQGFDLDGLVRKALAAVRGGRPAEVAGGTAFSELTATLTARDGVLSNRDLRATSALLSLAGAGTIDLAADRIDYLAKATVREPALGPLGDRLAELRDTPIPVRVTGSLAAPSVTVDVAEVLRSQAGRSIQRKVEEKLKGEWGDKLRKFLDR